MKKSILVIASLLMSTFVFCQEASSQKTTGGYGGPLISATQINDDWGILIGGKGGVILNQKFAFGGIGMGMASVNSFSGDNFQGDANADLDLSLGGGGVFFEYIYGLDSPIHFSIPINIMAGGVSIDYMDSEIESSGIFMLEPGINLEFKVSNNFMPGLHFSYRQVFGSDLINVSNEDLSGIVIGLVFKFGSFIN